MKYFWKKKAILSFTLALLVTMLHNSGIGQYFLQLELSSQQNSCLLFVNNLLTNTFVRVAVPLFFMLSGMTFFRNYEKGMYLSKLKHRIHTLIVPFLLWNIIGMFFEVFCSYTPIHNYFIVRERFLISAKNMFDAIFLYKCNPVFWFIFMLIIFVLLTPLFDFLTSKKWLAYCFLILSVFLPMFIYKYILHIPMVHSDISFNVIGGGSLVFYITGVVIGKYYLDDFIKKKNKKISILSICICLICVVLQMLNIYSIIVLPAIFSQALLCLFSISFWNSMDIIIDSIEVKDYMNLSFFIYAIHLNTQSIIVKIIYLIGPKSAWMAIPNFVISYIITICLIIFFARILMRICPRVYSLLVGSR